MLKIVVLLCVSVTYAHDDSPQGALSGFAQKLREEVVNNERSRFASSFSSIHQAVPITSMASGQLFTDPAARSSFNVVAEPGAKFRGPPGPNQQVKGKLTINVYNPPQRVYNEQHFKVVLEHSGRNTAADWRVNAIQNTGLFGN